MSTTEDQTPCPCCSGQTFQQCCGPYIEGRSLPATPEALMRSRYTAFTLANIDYIFATMAQKALRQSDPESTKTWAEHCQWLGLEVVDAPVPEADVGMVEFIAKYHEDGEDRSLRERSRFRKKSGKWYYVGEATVAEESKDNSKKVAKRNDPCPCGSGKKYKKCCLVQQESLT